MFFNIKKTKNFLFKTKQPQIWVFDFKKRQIRALEFLTCWPRGDLLRFVPHIKIVSKLISRIPWTTVGGMDWFSTPIDEMKHSNSNLDLPKSFWDFQILSVTH